MLWQIILAPEYLWLAFSHHILICGLLFSQVDGCAGAVLVHIDIHVLLNVCLHASKLDLKEKADERKTNYDVYLLLEGKLFEYLCWKLTSLNP